MEKQQIVSFIEGQLATGAITREDLLALAGGGTVVPQTTSFVPPPSTAAPIVVATAEGSSQKLIHTFYVIGGVIVIVGVIILIAQNWDEIGFMGRILVTIGIALATYISGLLLRRPEQRIISEVLFTIAAILAPIGTFVLLEEADITFNLNTQIIVSSILTIIFGTALLISKRNILILITIGFATWTYYGLIIKIFDVDYYRTDLLKWMTMLLGASYLLIAAGLRTAGAILEQAVAKERRAIQNTLYGLGSLAILGVGISMGGIFDLVFIAVLFAAFYGSVYLRSRSMLILGALFLMAHIIKLTSKYFVDSVGWPVALIVVGFLVIGVGYMTFSLNKRFISASRQS